MAEINLAQDEADKLMAMEKRAAGEKDRLFPPAGGRIMIPLTSLDKREHFMLDVIRSQINLTMATYQNRVRVVITLLRLDLGGRPHRNPDGEEIPCPHCTSIVRISVTSGPSPLPLRDTRICSTFFQRSKPSCSTVTSPNHPGFKRDYSHDHDRGD
jgi:hypothetical protein